ncbi:MAG: DNA-processing protein DprA [Candidatus Kapabacteria bacterium]|nr:DNA-processing protein DprA [Candidatus Kapabacteria bacterium]
MMKETAYWISLAHIPKWGYKKINSLIVKFFHDFQIPIDEFFHLDETDWKNKFHLEDKDINDLKKAKSEVASNSFLAESLLNQGYEILPIISSDYSKTLKENLKTSNSPPILYLKGNKNILGENSVAIVGSRNASKKALDFADNIAKLASNKFKVVVSGFAKGVDKQALDSAIKYKGQSIIVLPQGILTFDSGFKKYYKQIIDGDILVLSTFFPKAPWKAELAMARNPIIYGLAKEIFVAESSDKGGTWSGVIDGLRKGRKIYVLKPEIDDNNANNLLIQKGAIPVDFEGNELYKEYDIVENHLLVSAEEQVETYDLEKKIHEILTVKPMTATEILAKLDIDWKIKKMNNYLKKLNFIQFEKSGRRNIYKLRESIERFQHKLFDNS